MPSSLLIALALVLVIEGLLPLLVPRYWREMMSRAMSLSDGQLRFVGLLAVIAGLGVLILAGF